MANRPTATAANHTTGACSSRVWTKYEPTVATNPKKTNTNASPNPT